MKKTSEMLSSLPFMNNSVAVGLNFLIASVYDIINQMLLTLFFPLLHYSLLNVHRHHQLFVNNQYMPLNLFNSLIPAFCLPLISN